MLFFFVIRETIESLIREARRVAPMAAGIIWGVASVFILAAIANGFERSQRQVIEAFGDSFMLLRLNKPAHGKGDPRAQKQILIDQDDMERIRENATAIDAISPKGFIWFSRSYYGEQDSRVSFVGVDPEYNRICNVPLEPGSRWITETDIEQELPVVVIGPQVAQDLFQGQPAIGERILVSIGESFDRRSSRGDRTRIQGQRRGSQFSGGNPQNETERKAQLREFTVIGVIKSLELTDEFYVSNKQVGFIPYPVFERLEEKGAGFMVMKPKSYDHREAALADVRSALAERYHFDAEDKNTVLPYFDALERGRKIDSVFTGVKLFLGAVGVLILLLGAVGVANVVLMSVTARTFEFGLKRALGCHRGWIFLQIFLEASIVCVMSGVLGFLMGLSTVAGVNDLADLGFLPLPKGFARPIADLSAATIPGIILLVVTLCAALWPAWRAVRSDPVAALRGGAL
jgi:ABC-type antimicrobial peptide transport system permease subunit